MSLFPKGVFPGQTAKRRLLLAGLTFLNALFNVTGTPQRGYKIALLTSAKPL